MVNVPVRLEDRPDAHQLGGARRAAEFPVMRRGRYRVAAVSAPATFCSAPLIPRTSDSIGRT
jgi:hypothetical protein